MFFPVKEKKLRGNCCTTVVQLLKKYSQNGSRKYRKFHLYILAGIIFVYSNCRQGSPYFTSGMERKIRKTNNKKIPLPFTRIHFRLSRSYTGGGFIKNQKKQFFLPAPL